MGFWIIRPQNDREGVNLWWSWWLAALGDNPRIHPQRRCRGVFCVHALIKRKQLLFALEPGVSPRVWKSHKTGGQGGGTKASRVGCADARKLAGICIWVPDSCKWNGARSHIVYSSTASVNCPVGKSWSIFPDGQLKRNWNMGFKNEKLGKKIEDIWRYIVEDRREHGEKFAPQMEAEDQCFLVSMHKRRMGIQEERHVKR